MNREPYCNLNLYFEDGDPFVLDEKNVNFLVCDHSSKILNRHSIRRCVLSIKDTATHLWTQYFKDSEPPRLKDMDWSDLPIGIRMSDWQLNYADIDFYFPELILKKDQCIFSFYADDEQLDNLKAIFPKYA